MHSPTPTRLDPSLRSLLSAVRRRIRAYIWAEGIAAALVWLGIAFWISLALDWSLEPPRLARLVILVAAGLVLAWVLVQMVIRRLLVRLQDSSMAMIVERRFGHFHDSLLTAVELAHVPGQADFNPDMLGHTQAQAIAGTEGVRIGRVFRMRPLIGRVGAASLLVMSVAAFSLLASEAFGVWVDRNLQLSDALWPRKTRLEIEGFHGGAVKVARGSDLEIVVRADTSKEVVPDTVQIRYTTPDGDSQRVNMSRVGVAVAPAEPYQRYTYTFKGILSSLDFGVHGGDDRLRALHIDVVDGPVVTAMVLDCRYPAYMGRQPRQERVTGLMQLPAGTEISLSAEANKDLERVIVHRVRGEKTDAPQVIELSQGDRRRFIHRLGELKEDQTLLLTLHDADGLRSRDPVRLLLTAAPDEPPQLNVRLRGIGTAITSEARLPVEGEISDDYGLSRLWFEYRVGDAEPRSKPIAIPAGGVQRDVRLGGNISPALDIRDLKLAVGSKLALSIKAADNYALAAEPNVSAGEGYALEVVTPSQLLAMLEARELLLRRRFETAIDEMKETRDALARLASVAPTKDTAKQELEKRQLDASRSLASCERITHETLSIATAFEEIHEEVLNNRIDVAELNTRLRDGIVAPLHEIAENVFPLFEDSLRGLERLAADPAVASVRQLQSGSTTARGQADQILAAMDLVLQQMLKLEDFNQLVETLRELIDLQATINQRTLEMQKRKVRSLLED